MPWIIALSVVLLLTTLAGLFLAHAVVLRRDINAGFEHLRVRLEAEANAILRDMLNGHERS